MADVLIDLQQRALTTFESFLRHTREGASERTERVVTPQAPPPSQTTERTPRPASPDASSPRVSVAPAPSQPAAPVATEPRTGTRVEEFVQEMTTLVKYGHAAQVPREIERWVRAHPDALTEQLRVAEFELSRVDAATGLDRMYAVAARALDRGDGDVARLVLDRVRRVAPGDMRVVALAQRVGA